MRSRIIIGTVIVFLTGALAWVLPPHVLGQIVKHYPYTTWTWLGDGLSNAQPALSVPICFLIGFIYGLLIPKYWFLSFPAAWWVVPFNFLLDAIPNPQSHNLWPFELLIFAVLNIPTIIAAWLGRRFSPWYQPRQRGVM